MRLGTKISIGKEREKIFPKMITKGGTKNAARFTREFIPRFNLEANTNGTRDTLSRELIWSAKDVGFILYAVTQM